MTMSYCVKEKKNTVSLNPHYVTTKNGRLMMKSKCGSCGITKTRFVSTSGGNIGASSRLDIHKAMLPLLPKKGLTLPGYRYCGPGNPLDSGPPVNTLDTICEAHDYCYSSSIPKSVCDKNI